MVPLRIGDLDLWLFHCRRCEQYWCGPREEAWCQRQLRQAAAAVEYKSLSPSERRELTSNLADQVRDQAPEANLSPIQMTLALLGMPSVLGIRGGVTPWATWSLAALVLVAFLLLDPERVGFVVGESGLWDAWTASFAHFGWWHLLGNVYFLLAFGAGAEQRLGPTRTLALFFVAGLLGPLVESAFAPQGTLIGGASDSVAAIMGACFVLQRKAKVLIALPVFSLTVFRSVGFFRVPMLAFAAFEFAFQLFMAALGIPGTAWWAHLSALAMGVLAGLATHLRDAA